MTRRILKLQYRDEIQLHGNQMGRTPLPRPVVELLRADHCVYCGDALSRSIDGTADSFGDEIYLRKDECPTCGWWRRGWYPAKFFVGETHIGVLQRTVPGRTSEVLDALADGVFTSDRAFMDLTPTSFERRVGEILAAAFGYEAVHTGRSGDGGIDLLLFDSEEGPIAVQVKHRQRDGRPEGVEVVRELRGAMVLAGTSRGLVVTTSDRFTKGARAIALPESGHLVAQTIDLIDARGLVGILSSLLVGQTPRAPREDVWPWSAIHSDDAN